MSTFLQAPETANTQALTAAIRPATGGANRVHCIAIFYELNGGDYVADRVTNIRGRGQNYTLIVDASAQSNGSTRMRACHIWAAKEAEIIQMESAADSDTEFEYGNSGTYELIRSASCHHFTIQDFEQSTDLTSTSVAAGPLNTDVDATPFEVTLSANTNDLVVFGALNTQNDTSTWSGATKHSELIVASAYSGSIASTQATTDGDVTAGITPDAGITYATTLFAVAFPESQAPANQAPVANDDTATTSVDTQINIAVLDNDTDADGDSLTVSSASALNGTVGIEANNTLTYTPNNGYTGADTIVYEVSDGNGGTDTGSVAITVTAQPTAPSGPPSGAPVSGYELIRIDQLGQWDLIDDQFLSGELEVGDYVYTTRTNGDDPATGVFVQDVTYTAYAWDLTDDTWSPAFTFVFPGPNTAPIAVNDTATTDEDTPITINVLSNDTDADGDALTVTVATALNGSVVIESNNELTYTPNSGFTGSDTITYTVSDGNGGTDTTTVNITVAAVGSGDTTSPVISFQNVPASVSALSAVTLSINVSESVSGLSLSDFVTVNASASNFVTLGGASYTVDITPDGNGDISVSLAQGAAQDGAGNGSDAATTSITWVVNSGGGGNTGSGVTGTRVAEGVRVNPSNPFPVNGIVLIRGVPYDAKQHLIIDSGYEPTINLAQGSAELPLNVSVSGDLVFLSNSDVILAAENYSFEIGSNNVG